MTVLPEIRAVDLEVGRQLRRKALSGWYLGDEVTLGMYSGRHVGVARTTPELVVSLLLSRDRMHHSVGWWRNAEYEYCWHMSICCWDTKRYNREYAKPPEQRKEPAHEEIPDAELRYWAFIIFGELVKYLWHEPGGTDPRLSREEALDRKNMVHLRMFMNPLTMRPFIPTGEVYHLTKWIPGLTPEKVDR